MSWILSSVDLGLSRLLATYHDPITITLLKKNLEHIIKSHYILTHHYLITKSSKFVTYLLHMRVLCFQWYELILPSAPTVFVSRIVMDLPTIKPQATRMYIHLILTLLRVANNSLRWLSSNHTHSWNFSLTLQPPCVCQSYITLDSIDIWIIDFTLRKVI